MIKLLKKRFIPIILLWTLSVLGCDEPSGLPLPFVPGTGPRGTIEVSVTPEEVNSATGDQLYVQLRETGGVQTTVDSVIYTVVAVNGNEMLTQRGKFTYALFLEIWNGVPVLNEKESMTGSFHSFDVFSPGLPVNSKGLLIFYATDANSFAVTDTAEFVFK